MISGCAMLIGVLIGMLPWLDLDRMSQEAERGPQPPRRLTNEEKESPYWQDRTGIDKK